MSDSNIELQLKKLNGEDVVLPEPQSRVELYLAKLNGESVELPEPKSRVEELLYALTKKSNDNDSIIFVDAIVRSLSGELVDITLPSKFDTITEVSENFAEFYLPSTTQSISSESAKVITPRLCYETLIKSINCPAVTIVGEEAFYSCDELVDIYLPLVEQIDTSAFGGCTSLKTVVLPSLRKIGSTVFSGEMKKPSLTTLKLGTLVETQIDSFKLANRLSASKALLAYLEVGEGTSADLYIQYSEAYTQEVLHKIIENLADLTGREIPGEFSVGTVNLEKIDAEHIKMLQDKNWNYS